MDLPEEYRHYIACNGPKEGALSIDPGWFQLWSPDDVITYNQSYRVQEFAPGFLGFGSSGGGEMLAFDEAGHVFMLPFVGMRPAEARLISDSWSEFVNHMESSE